MPGGFHIDTRSLSGKQLQVLLVQLFHFTILWRDSVVRLAERYTTRKFVSQRKFVLQTFNASQFLTKMNHARALFGFPHSYFLEPVGTDDVESNHSCSLMASVEQTVLPCAAQCSGFLFNLLISQFCGVYNSLAGDIKGYARLARGLIILDSLKDLKADDANSGSVHRCLDLPLGLIQGSCNHRLPTEIISRTWPDSIACP